MIPNMCKVKHNPPDTYGDCFRTCIASILNFNSSDNVPHFNRDGNDERSLAEFKEWLHGHISMRPFYMAYPATTSLDDIYAMMKGVNTDIEYLLFCKCGGGDHVVICQNDKVIHDPAWYRSSISGPCENGYWVIMVLVPINP